MPRHNYAYRINQQQTSKNHKYHHQTGRVSSTCPAGEIRNDFMTTLSRMHQQILLTKLRLFVHRNRKRVTRKPIFVTTEVMRPRNTIARCYSVLSSSDKKTCRRPIGYEICISPIWLRRTVTQTGPWKMLMLHEIAHTSRLARGHDMVFKRTARRIGADYMARQPCCFITK